MATATGPTLLYMIPAPSTAAVALAGMPEVWQRLLTEHVPDRQGRCVACRWQTRAADKWPCDVPDTLITNRADAVRRFAGGGATVAKALGAPAIREDGTRKTAFTSRIDGSELADLRGVELTAHQFQRWVPKAFESRVIVVGDRVFAAAIHAGNAASYVDWRNDYGALRYEPIMPPGSVSAGVVGYCAELGLIYGAFDFVIRPDGQWTFLECNPGGQFGWIEDAISAPIIETIADLLCEEPSE